MPLIRPNHTPLAFLIVAFLLAREVGFFVLTEPTDADIYLDYAAAARADSLAGLYRARTVEYPPAAVAFVLPAVALADALPEEAGQWAGFRRGGTLSTPFGLRFQAAFGLYLFAFDVVVLAAVVFLARRLYPEEGNRGPVLRGAAYVAATTLLAPILYDRLDLIVGLVAVAAVAAFRAGRPAVVYAALAAGTAFKLVPALILPVFVFAAAAGRAVPRGVLREGAVAAGILALAPAVTYLIAGAPGFGFLTYHANRGVEIETVYAWVAALADRGAPVVFTYGCHNPSGAAADRAAAVAPWVFAAGMAAVYAAVGRAFLRAAKREPGEDPTPRLVAGCVAVWLAFLLLNKVGSPQYLLWLAPLVPLLPRRAGWRVGWVGAFLALCLLATLIYPVYYYRHVCGRLILFEPVTHAGPSGFGIALLAARTALLVGLLADLLPRLRADPHG